MKWEILDTGVRSAEENMALDRALLADLELVENPILHLYEWEGASATYGHFVDPAAFLDLEGAEREGLELAKRPTGGGIVFHNCDLAFSVLLPASHPAFSRDTLENYAFVNRRVIRVVEAFLKEGGAELLPEEPMPLDADAGHFCMAKPTKYDVMVGGKKVGGAAQRRTQAGFLHQGTLSLGLLPERFRDRVLKPETRVYEGMQAHTYPLLGEEWDEKGLEEGRAALRELLKTVFCEEE